MKQSKLVKNNEADEDTLSHLTHIETLEYFDGQCKDLPISDIIVLADLQNGASSCVAKLTTTDKMTTIVSFLALNPFLHRKSVSSVTDVLVKKSVLHGLSIRTLRRYVTVGLALVHNKPAYLLFQRFGSEKPSATCAPGGMALSLLSHSAFTLANRESQVLSLICLNRYFQTTASAGDKSGLNTALREADAGTFFKDCCTISAVVEVMRKARKMSALDVFDFQIGHDRRGNKITASDFIANLMAAWKPHPIGERKSWIWVLRNEIFQRLLIALPQRVDVSPKALHPLRERNDKLAKTVQLGSAPSEIVCGEADTSMEVKIGAKPMKNK